MDLLYLFSFLLIFSVNIHRLSTKLNWSAYAIEVSMTYQYLSLDSTVGRENQL